jgi:hypothetical protein
MQNAEIYPQTKVFRKAGHIWVTDQIPEAFAGYVRASPLSHLNRAYVAFLPGYQDFSRTCPDPSVDMSGLANLSQRLSPSQTYPAPDPSSKKSPGTCLASQPYPG